MRRMPHRGRPDPPTIVPMSDTNVIPFRRRSCAESREVGREMYERMTRSWHPEIKELMFPEQFKQEQERRSSRGVFR